MNRIVDIHGHYVFEVDDGAETLPMALELKICGIIKIADNGKNKRNL